jgi:crotonobetainyl-CoA:carnitine CoA-transferase CaiB-like acyl-CoA transferase
VIDLSRVLAGPYCSMMLADLGADVVKVEHPEGGDETRSWGPPYAGGESAYYLSVNRTKRSVAIDLKQPEGRDLALRLCDGADIVLENFRVGGADRLGLGYEAVSARNPKVVYCSITGFGSGRSPQQRAGYDFVAQAESGLMSITGWPDGEPTKVGVAAVDVLTGLHAGIAVLAALHRGEGEHVEVSLLDAGFSSLVNQALNALVTGEDPPRHGNAHPNIVPYEAIRASDGWVALAAANDGLFRRLCDVLGRPDLAADERFSTNPARVTNRGELIPLLNDLFAARTADEWVAALAEAGVPAGKTRGVREAFQAAADAGRDPIARIPHPTAGEVELVRSPFVLERGAVAEPVAPPLLGQHTREVLAELGLSEEEMDALAGRGAIGNA